MEYANKSVRMMRRQAGIAFDAFCITERPDELDRDIQPIAPKIKVAGWWNKLLTFDKDMPKGWIVVMDVDLLIVNSLKDILQYAFQNTRQMAAYSDAIHWRNCKLSSSLMIFRSGDLHHIYERFKFEMPTNETYHGAGDQGWMAQHLTDILYLDEVFPNFKQSLKVDLARAVNGNTFEIQSVLGSQVRIVDFHGRPKPHECLSVPFVRDNWR